MNTRQIICNSLQMFQFYLPRQFVNILIQIRQKITIVSILHNNYVLFCFWVLCHSIKFKEFITCAYALDMISKLLNKNKYRVRLNVTLINTTDCYLLTSEINNSGVSSKLLNRLSTTVFE